MPLQESDAQHEEAYDILPVEAEDSNAKRRSQGFLSFSPVKCDKLNKKYGIRNQQNVNGSDLALTWGSSNWNKQLDQDA